MKAPKIFKFKRFIKKSGKLLPITFDKKFPIIVKRIFLVYGKKNYKRGDHAHKKCSQFFIPIFGKVLLKIRTPDTKKTIYLNHLSKTGVLIPPKYWCGVKFIKENSILMVVCDRIYEFSDYLESFNEYIEYLRKK